MLDDVCVFIVLNLKIVEIFRKTNAPTSVRLFPWLDDPNGRWESLAQVIELFLGDNVVGQRDKIEGIAIKILIVANKIVE